MCLWILQRNDLDKTPKAKDIKYYYLAQRRTASAACFSLLLLYVLRTIGRGNDRLFDYGS